MTSPTPAAERYVVESDPAVDVNLLEVIGPSKGLMRSEATNALDEEMRRLVMGRHVLDLAIGRALRPVVMGRCSEDCGAVRLRDYATEVLGVSDTTLRKLVKRDEELSHRETLRDAFLDGRVLATQVDLILRQVKDPAEDSAYVEAARQRTVRGLAQFLREGLPEGEREAAKAAGADAEGQVPTGLFRTRTFRLHGPVYADYLSHREFASRVAGAEITDSEALELLAAEYLSGAPLAGQRDAAPADPDPQISDDDDEDPPSGVPPQPDNRAELAEELRQILEEISNRWECLCQTPVQAEVAADLLDGPTAGHELHEHLQHLFRVRHRLGLFIGRMLHTFKCCRLYRDCDFVDIYHYASERLGLGRSTTAELIARDGKLAGQADVFDAIYSGTLKVAQADLVLACSGPETARPWIDYARKYTVRHLKDVARVVKHLKTMWWVWNGRKHMPPGPGETVETLRADAERGVLAREEAAWDGLVEDVASLAGYVLNCSTLAVMDAEIHVRLREWKTMQEEYWRRALEVPDPAPGPTREWTDEEILAVRAAARARLLAGDWPRPVLTPAPEAVQMFSPGAPGSVQMFSQAAAVSAQASTSEAVQMFSPDPEAG